MKSEMIRLLFALSYLRCYLCVFPLVCATALGFTGHGLLVQIGCQLLPPQGGGWRRRSFSWQRRGRVCFGTWDWSESTERRDG